MVEMVYSSHKNGDDWEMVNMTFYDMVLRCFKHISHGFNRTCDGCNDVNDAPHGWFVWNSDCLRYVGWRYVGSVEATEVRRLEVWRDSDEGLEGEMTYPNFPKSWGEPNWSFILNIDFPK